MPKKTRREKILADFHKRQTHRSPILLSNDEKSEEIVQVTTPSEGYRFTYSGGHREHERSVDASGDTSHDIHHDLVKTIALALVALAIEFFLYWFFKTR